ncbi:MAG: hypothetical protein A3B99_02155 [Candidatus Yanofskybacteria bacterium RIFCSPHIGHO2_02_FULL_44_12b]|uniref:DUF5667 domain-containing protein n=2 Tax=Candidatus Yanofskyibacteriota TaxID=1752733 RepID=A0A1F8GNF5_9BACT|nr:MAG: hypothetical protein UW79_C0012G0023 [Candidatus Yanofskybacteria bacterium GW2011_GWA2_44_9]OGN05203.1 MAG: hypothetical protein A2659_04230 [Candidatus Yanofskybacteria bacterium RIFCSPHIGHO2_01_FULL_44_24]OGN15261.1 MAG: hypothetical protein A3B99_02155 [Candidatus Yanofskybacteria bacterium RIFCSPHIGHO2_02_FULL_44_12b]OGN26924.1 MAG: hypothetical protein A2925_01490 [Candidatus Yanofskybacteria bacterium RIFCSPLOWO2_01_FULL_44_22]
MQKKPKSRGSPRLLIAGLAVVIFSMSASCAAFNLSGFKTALGRFSFYVKDYDRQNANQEFRNLKSYYDYFSGWGLKNLADRYLLPDAFLYESVLAYLEEDWEKVEADLKSHQDDPRAVYLSAIAKFRVLKAAYHSEAAKKNAKIREEILQKVAMLKLDFEKCIKGNPDQALSFNCAFDYDLVSDPKSAKKAMESKAPGRNFVLGDPNLPGQGDKPGKDKDNLDRMADDPKPGQNSQRKGG